MSTTPLHDVQHPEVSPAAPAETPPAGLSTRKAALSRRIRSATLRRRLSQATDTLAVIDLLLGMNRSVQALQEDPA